MAGPVDRLISALQAHADLCPEAKCPCKKDLAILKAAPPAQKGQAAVALAQKLGLM